MPGTTWRNSWAKQPQSLKGPESPTVTASQLIIAHLINCKCVREFAGLTYNINNQQSQGCCENVVLRP